MSRSAVMEPKPRAPDVGKKKTRQVRLNEEFLFLVQKVAAHESPPVEPGDLIEQELTPILQKKLRKLMEQELKRLGGDQ